MESPTDFEKLWKGLTPNQQEIFIKRLSDLVYIAGVSMAKATEAFLKMNSALNEFQEEINKEKITEELKIRLRIMEGGTDGSKFKL